MPGTLVRRVCTAATAAAAACALAAQGTAAATPEPAPGPGEHSVAGLLTDLQRLYRQSEEATETYNATAEKLRKQRKKVAGLHKKLKRARLDLHHSRVSAGRLAREQYQGSSDFSPYLRLLLAGDPQQALDQTHVIQRVSADRATTVRRLTGDEKKADGLATAARGALDKQETLAERQKKQRDTVQNRLGDVEKMLSSLDAGQLAKLGRLERSDTADAQRTLVASGALSSTHPPSEQGNKALDWAVRQIGKPYAWGAEGPNAYDCSGLTSQAWERAGRAIPRTSQEQWARLPRVSLRELRPGDLVVYFPKATHVAMYLGDGMVVQAPRPGTVVKVSPVGANPVRGAVRPDPGAASLADYHPPELPAGATEGSDLGYGGAPSD